MGQGHFAGIVYGCILEDEATMDALARIIRAWERHLKSQGVGPKRRTLLVPRVKYETVQHWIGFWVAITDDLFARWYGGVLWRKDALRLSRRGVAEKFPQTYRTARLRWQNFAQFAAERGQEIEGGLLLVTDRD